MRTHTRSFTSLNFALHFHDIPPFDCRGNDRREINQPSGSMQDPVAALILVVTLMVLSPSAKELFEPNTLKP